ncbi:MAG: hypothetical protein WA821_20025 [Anaerolineales bacterium]
MRARYPVPYRGQPRPKVYGYPSPPKPFYRAMEYVFWFVVTIIGIGILYLTLISPANYIFGGFFVFAIYLIFLVIAIFAFRDAKRIKTITSDEDIQAQKDGQDAAPAEDRFIEVEEVPAHHKGRYPAHINTPISRWRYRIVKHGSANRFFVIIFLGMGVFVGIVIIFGASPQITIGLITILSLAFLANYLMKD